MSPRAITILIEILRFLIDGRCRSREQSELMHSKLEEFKREMLKNGEKTS